MTILEAVILGIIQGVTEFLPVSSSGHLVLIQRLLGIDGQVIMFDLILHGATLIAVGLVMLPELKKLLSRDGLPAAGKILLATLPTVLIAVLFKGFFRASFGGEYLGWGFMISAVLLLFTDMWVLPGADAGNLTAPLLYKVSPSNALVTGIAQGVAILPGISRSGSTVCTALIMGADRSSAAKLSFLMSIPVIMGGMLFEAVDLGTQTITIGAAPIIAGFAAAAVSGYVSVRFMLKIIQKFRFYGFSVYLAVLSVFCFIVI